MWDGGTTDRFGLKNFYILGCIRLMWVGPQHFQAVLNYMSTVQRPRPKPLESNEGQLRSARAVNVGWTALGLRSIHEGSSTGNAL